jgi:tellurite resistance protein
MMRKMEDPGPSFIRDLEGEQLEALVETMFLVAFADGDYGEAERKHFERSVAMLTGGRLGGESFDHVITRMVRRVRENGRDGCIGSLKRRLPTDHMRQVALILAMDMAAADGVLHPDERTFIEAMASGFGMTEHVMREVLEGPLA